MRLLPLAALLLLAVLCGRSYAAAVTLPVYETAGTHYEVGYNVGALMGLLGCALGGRDYPEDALQLVLRCDGSAFQRRVVTADRLYFAPRLCILRSREDTHHI